MKISKERREELKQLVRKALIRDNSMSCRRMGALLGIDYKFANRLMNEVREENVKLIREEIEKLKKTTIEEEIVNYDNEVRELIIELWKIISSGETTKRDKISAIRALVLARRQLFDIKFDAGLFARKLGEMDLNIPELVKLVKENAKESGDDNKGGSEL